MNKLSKFKTYFPRPEKIRNTRETSPICFGQSLFEVVVAVGLSAIILAGIVSLAAGSIRNSSFTRNNAQATKFAQEEIEWLRGKRDSGWSIFVGVGSSIAGGGCEGSFSWGGSCTINSVFTRTATFECFFLDITSSVKTPKNCITDLSSEINVVDATVTVSWIDSQGSHGAQSKTRFTDWRK